MRHQRHLFLLHAALGCACLVFLAATATYAGDDAFSGQRLVSGSGTTLGYYALAVKPSDVNVVYAGGSGSELLALTHTSSGGYAAPTVSTGTVGAITNISAAGGGEITDLGSASATSHGVCWNTGGSPTTADDCNNLGAASATGAFTAFLTGLAPGSTYYVRAFATNSSGTGYGDQVSFTTSGSPGSTVPVISTLATTNISGTTALGHGTVTDVGGCDITDKGVCWNSTGGPTLATAAHSSGGSGSSAFSALASGLTQNTSYYIRAYATNCYGTSYGDVRSFVAGKSGSDSDGSGGGGDSGDDGDGGATAVPGLDVAGLCALGLLLLLFSVLRSVRNRR